MRELRRFPGLPSTLGVAELWIRSDLPMLRVFCTADGLLRRPSLSRRPFDCAASEIKVTATKLEPHCIGPEHRAGIDWFAGVGIERIRVAIWPRRSCRHQHHSGFTPKKAGFQQHPHDSAFLPTSIEPTSRLITNGRIADWIVYFAIYSF